MTNRKHQRRAAESLALAGQLLEIECAIHGGGATDADAHAFIDGLSAQQQADVLRALKAMWPRASADLQPTDAAVDAALKVTEFTTLREWSIGIALMRNFNRAEMLKLATRATERMGQQDGEQK